MFCCGGRPPCIFCHVSKERGFLVVYEDGDLIAFHDRSPAAQLHLLVITKRHIGTVKNLDSSDVDLLQKMVQRGELLLKEHGFDADSGHQVR
ncbi:HIT-like domain-containing protein [Radiomyces spectabilis]|uniref:HIT-like domain-containing protein n=1 Tax=Radiomyces spectabilis TaxID=64574 RepID=UPI00222072D7|nr:HIT-like domain-containing protein [Radiomyces spectabilis]KAI8371385.1 HIT-like domain-containing protein [Radiomyces spectabilis]